MYNKASYITFCRARFCGVRCRGGSARMDCKEAQAKISDYIKGRLSTRELEAFISHVRKCPVCYEELETYYTIHLAVAMLDEGEQNSYDFSGRLDRDIREKEHVLRSARATRRFLLAAALALLVVLAAVILLNYDRFS